ncbi:MAG TPA: hypothetical protein VEL76_24890 [Gemmataceae bacterium]|nr:hypothetical protein [Gemmataceae bacterium]
MAWNLELACVRVSAGATLQQVVPDVFSPTGEHLSFEEATSVARGLDLCATLLGEWAVLIDVACRLSAAVPWLKEVSVGRDVYVFRIADVPAAVHYREGKAAAKHDGLVACLRALGRSKPERGEHVDGEEIACDLLRARTGLEFPGAFWKAQFVVFTTTL